MAKALVIIDPLVGYLKDAENPERIVQNIVKLAKAFQNKKQKVILFIPDFKNKNPVMIKLWGNEFENSQKDKKLAKELINLKYDKIIKKKAYSGFYKTDFESYCRKNKISELYLAGFFSSCCIFFTAADTAYRHIQPYLVTDASGEPKKPLVKPGWQKNSFERFKMMLGPLIKTNVLIKKIKMN